MITVRARSAVAAAILLCAAVLLGLPGCSREQQDWRAAERADTLESYGLFIEHHPESELTTQARERITQLGEDRDWKQAGATNTAEAYRGFLAQHPIGKWSQEARIRIESFSLGPQPVGPPAAPLTGTGAGAGTGNEADAGTRAVADARAGASPGPAAPAPGASASAAAAAPVPASAPELSAAPTRTAMKAGAGAADSPAVQLGAFSSQAAASSEWKQLSARFAPQLRGLTPTVVPASTASGPLFRLQAKVADEAHARALCDALRKQSQACVPLIAH